MLIKYRKGEWDIKGHRFIITGFRIREWTKNMENIDEVGDHLRDIRVHPWKPRPGYPLLPTLLPLKSKEGFMVQLNCYIGNIRIEGDKGQPWSVW